MTILLTDAAHKHISEQLQNRGNALGIRISVTTMGCSGMAYVLEFVDDLNEDDEIFIDRGIKIFVESKSLIYIDGTVMDFVKEGVNEGFRFKNPNSKGECGCGESFNI